MFSTKLKASVCSAYLIAYDVSNIVGILIYNVPTIIQLAYGKNGSESSVIWCRAMNCVGNICLIYGPLTLCLASIDRYLCTSRQASRRKWSSMKVARISLIVAFLASFALLTPDLIYWNINHNIQRCIAENLYYQYMSYFVYPIMTCFVPLIILSAFGYKTYRNLRTSIHPTRSTGTDESRKSRMDYRWTRMILIQTLVCADPCLSRSSGHLLYHLYLQYRHSLYRKERYEDCCGESGRSIWIHFQQYFRVHQFLHLLFSICNVQS